MDWVQLSVAIEPNRTANFVWVWFLNQSNSIELNWTQSIRLCSIGLGSLTQSNTIQWIAFNCVLWVNLLEQRLCYASRKHEKHVLYWSNSSLEKLILDFQHQFYKKIMSSEIKSSIWFGCPIIFVWVWFGLIAELNRTQSMNWVWFCAIEFDWNTVWLGLIDYGGILRKINFSI